MSFFYEMIRMKDKPGITHESQNCIENGKATCFGSLGDLEWLSLCRHIAHIAHCFIGLKVKDTRSTQTFTFLYF